MRVRVKDGFTKTLCVGCMWSTAMETSSGDQAVYCSEISQYVPPIRTCSSFKGKQEKSRGELEEIAWLIEMGPAKKIGFGQIKFISPKDPKHEEFLRRSRY